MPAAAKDELQTALGLHRSGQLEAAARLYRQVLAAAPARPDIWQMLGLAEFTQGHLPQALEAFDAAARLAPGDAGVTFNRGLVLHQAGRSQEALEAFEFVLSRQPAHPKAPLMKAQALHALGRIDEAVRWLDAAATSAADPVPLWLLQGEWLHGLHDHAGAAEAYRRVLGRQPTHADALCNLGSCLLRAGRAGEAVDVLSQALRVAPAQADLWFNHGLALARLQRRVEAEQSLGEALRLAPGLAVAWTQRGLVRSALRRLDAAVADFEQALRIDPGQGDAWAALGHARLDLGDAPAAVDAYQKALAIAPQTDFLLDALALARARLCDWRHAQADREAIEAAIRRGSPLVSPARIFALMDRPDLLLPAARSYITHLRMPAALTAPAFQPAGQRLRIGYFSADLHAHATAFLMARLFERHDRERFEIVGFQLGPARPDAMHERLRAAFDEFHDIDALDDVAAARLARERGLQIAVDLKGLSLHARPGVFAARAAPLQVAYLGYPCTLGADWMDYLVADATVVPPDARAHYSEKIITLPGSYQVNDETRACPAPPPRSQVGLPEDAFVFCSLNSPYKITAEVFATWMALLREVPGSVLWQLDGGEGPRQHLLQAAASQGIDPSRIRFAPLLDPQAHLARIGCADLFLDTLPCNAHTSASDALWMGVPVVTLAGAGFAGRVGASLLQAAGLPELICPTLADYRQTALALATQPGRLLALKRHLAGQRHVLPLFDSGRFTRHLECAFEMIWQRHSAGLPPEHVDVPAD